ncbi:MAG TPA: flavodoxin family protein [Firmicutes bacterium]|nr:flavodoxin family protein [Bacillota bacterium]
MPVLALLGSPRRGGNTETLLHAFIEGGEKAGASFDVIRVSDLNIKPCSACDACAITGECIIDDDMQEIYCKIDAAEGLVIASPIYFGGVSAQLKAVIDRMQKYWFIYFGRGNKKAGLIPKGRPGYFLGVGGMKNKKYCQCARTTAETVFLSSGFSMLGSLCFSGYDAKGALSADKQALQEIYEGGREFAFRL